MTDSFSSGVTSGSTWGRGSLGYLEKVRDITDSLRLLEFLICRIKIRQISKNVSDK